MSNLNVQFEYPDMLIFIYMKLASATQYKLPVRLSALNLDPIDKLNGTMRYTIPDSAYISKSVKTAEEVKREREQDQPAKPTKRGESASLF